MATKKASAKQVAKKSTSKRSGTTTTKSMPKEGKNPKGGLTAKGREFFNRTEGSHLKPGVTGAADTPEKLKRKGSFLRRHFTHPRGPMQDDKGRPTRLALSAHAWGEPVPKDMAAAKKLAAKGHELLEKYHAAQDKTAAKKSSARNSAAKRTAVSAKASPLKKVGKVNGKATSATSKASVAKKSTATRKSATKAAKR